jgi:DNA-directed RNA polymerase subunit H
MAAGSNPVGPIDFRGGETHMAKKQSFDVTQHVLVPTHELCTKEEREQVLQQYGAGIEHMPRILITDPAIKELGCEVGDLIRIERVQNPS